MDNSLPLDVMMYVRGIAALAVVLGLILGLLWAARKFNLMGLGGRASARRRLAVLETLQVDAKHKLVLIARDGRQHLLLLGNTADLVVESNIVIERRAAAPGQGSAPAPTPSLPQGLDRRQG